MKKIMIVIKILIKRYFPLDSFIYYFDFLTLKKLLKDFFFNFLKKLYKYIFIILPVLLIIKVLYSFFYLSNVDIKYLGIECISNIPFLGGHLIDYFNLESPLISKDVLIKNQFISQLMFIGGIGGCFGWSIINTFILGKNQPSDLKKSKGLKKKRR